MNVYHRFDITKKFAAIMLILTITACGGGSGGSTSAGGTINPFISALSNNEGLRSFMTGTSYYSIFPSGSINTASANSDGTYTWTESMKSLKGGVWGTYAPSYANYYLDAAGNWVLRAASNAYVVTPNTNGTITLSVPNLGSVTVTPVEVDLSGSNINNGKDVALNISSGIVNVKVGYNYPVDSGGYYVISPGVSVISTMATYPTGAKEWILSGAVSPKDEYNISGLPYFIAATLAGNLTDVSLVAASSFTRSNPLCVGYSELVYTGATTNIAHFDVYGPVSTCTAILAGATKLATVDLTFTTVRNQPIAIFGNYSLPGTQFPFVTVTPAGTESGFLATVNGKVYFGTKTPANYEYDNTNLTKKSGLKNKVAIDAVMNAVGIPTF